MYCSVVWPGLFGEMGTTVENQFIFGKIFAKKKNIVYLHSAIHLFRREKQEGKQLKNN